MNLDGISKLSKERLLDELKKILNPKILTNITKDNFCIEISAYKINLIYPIHFWLFSYKIAFNCRLVLMYGINKTAYNNF